MQKYTLTVAGCDNTTIVDLKLTKTQFEFLNNVCKQVTETSMSSCMPTMNLKDFDEEEYAERC